MNEIKKTFIFIGASALILVVAWWINYTPTINVATDMRGKPLCPNLTDALAAASLEILEYDPNAVRIKTFKVAQINNRWCIPSHENYPADAKQHLAEAATSLIGVKILDVASESPTRDELVMYGVVEPDSEIIKTVTRGVGKRVIFRDRSDKTLADVIIGNKVPNREELRYVRVKGQDPVYVVKLSDDKFSSEFGDWIEKDLLQLNPWDIRDVQLHDYSFDPITGSLTPRAQIVLSYDDLGNPRWKLTQSLLFDGNTGTWSPRSLAEDEELDTSKLDSLRTALDDLKIVDVRRKPQGISASLSADGSVKANQETAASLSQAGFYLASAEQFYRIFPMIGQRQIKPGDIEVVSSEGEIRVGMKDGVRYLLRFGRVVEGQGSSAEQSGSGVNRYLFVVAEFDPELIPKPELQPLPELPPETQQQSKEPAQQQSSTAESKSAAEGAATPSATSQTTTNPAGQSETPKETQPQTTANAPTQNTQSSQQGSESPSAGTQSQGQEGNQAQSEQAKKPEDIKAERERIEKENKRKQDEYQEKLKKGQERVKELNARFADWYYIISDEVYRKIHLGLNDIIKKKEKPAEQSGETKQETKQETQPTQGQAAEQPPTGPAAGTEQKPQESAQPAQPQTGAASEPPAAGTATPAPEPPVTQPDPVEKPATEVPGESPQVPAQGQ